MEIKFLTTDEHTRSIYDIPKPATLFIPKWYKDMPSYIGYEHGPGISPNGIAASNMTLKGCSPFLDALSTGYIWSSPADIEIRKDEKNKDFSFKWRVDDELITDHSPLQHPGLPLGDNNFVLKWNFRFIIKTPPGYSTIFTHPLNRFDLPFRTFSGVVDTDTYELPIQFPFLWNDSSDSYILEKGTPLCQFFPIKRENWNSEKIEQEDIEYWKKIYKFFDRIERPYKLKHWKRKVYQ